jgi:hypothetical protein
MLTTEIDSHLSWPDWQELFVPAEVGEVRGELRAAVERAHGSAEGVRRLDADEARERREAEAAVQRAAEAGEPLPEVVLTDWTAERLRREGLHEVHRKQLQAAHQRHREIVQAHRPARVARIAEEVEKRRAVAQEALAAAEGPILAFAELNAELDVLTPQPEFHPADFIEAAKEQMPPQVHAYAHRKAAELAEEAKEAHRQDRNRRRAAPRGLELIAGALRP